MKYEDDYNFDENDFEYAMDLYAESMDKDEEVDDILDDEEETDDEEDVTLQLAKDYKAVNITLRYLNNQLDKMELSRDKIKFYYDDELICGHVIGKFQKSDKYIFIVKNLRTGELEKRSLSLSLIENFD